jgi:prepilin-type N-terminal cleavage/methylation domain-containing protein
MNRTLTPESAPVAPPRAAARRRRRAARGFTLIEIIVSLSAGLMVSVAAFSMSKNATNFFQHEARISSAQLALTLGLNRLTADIQRAAFLASPNAQVDPMVCRDPSWTAGLHSFAGLTILKGPNVALSQAAANGLRPDQVIVGGSLDTSEIFTVQCVTPGAGGGPALQLQTAVYDNAMARVQASLGPTELLANKLALIFVPGRYVNVFDPATGFHVYGIVGAAPNPVVVGGVATVQLAGTVALPTKPTSPCGIVNPAAGAQCGGGLMVSAVSRYLYDVRSLTGLATGNYGKLVTPLTPGTTGDNGRTELVRVELDAAGSEVPASLQLISEYTVDMRFGITVSTKIANDSYNPTVISYGINDPNVYSIAGDVTASTTSTGAAPQLIRAVQVRLATRARAPDRNTDLTQGADGRRLHYAIPSVQPGFVRVRTNYANVALPNQGGFSLW